MKRVAHLCITYKQLLVSITTAVKDESAHHSIFFPCDYQEIEDGFSKRLREEFIGEHINFIFDADSVHLSEYKSLCFLGNNILTRNITYKDGTFYSPFSWAKKYFNYGVFDKCFLYHSGPFISKILSGASAKVILREDGLSNYVKHPIPLWKGMIRFFFGLPVKYQVWGEESWIDELEIESLDKLPQEVRFKAKKSPINAVKEISNDVKLKSKFQRAFCLPSSFVLNESGHKKVLLLTQPIDDVGYVSEQKKINIYQEMINRLSLINNCDVYVKQHPRESSFSYSNAIPLPKDFPIELIVGNQSFTISISLCSTASAIELADINVSMIPLEMFNKSNVLTWDSIINAELEQVTKRFNMRD